MCEVPGADPQPAHVRTTMPASKPTAAFVAPSESLAKRFVIRFPYDALICVCNHLRRIQMIAVDVVHYESPLRRPLLTMTSTKKTPMNIPIHGKTRPWNSNAPTTSLRKPVGSRKDKIN